ncbi:MerR family transcriptional regulator [Tenacibaculum aestuarii]|uniref:MerR family transcriptional regulator n=1 Tax=Tenacibaculum aestuarii TaxID=362781 RepID=UPI003893A46D
MDINKLKDLSPKIQEKAINEILNNTSENLYELANSKLLNYCLHENKSGIKVNITPKLLNDWIKKGIVHISEDDKGKVKRFDKLESIWLHLIADLRKFGFPLEKIKHIREQLDFKVKNFTYFKYNVLKTIFGEENYMLIFETGEISFISIETYQRLTKRGKFPIHLTVNFTEYVTKVFKNNSFSIDFNYLENINDIERTKLLFFLKTNSFKEIRITVEKGDTRLITESSELENNSKLKEILINWNFSNMTIIIDDYIEVDIVNTGNTTNGK